MTLIVYVVSEIRTTEDVVRVICKKPRLLDPSTSNMVNGPKECWNLDNSTFIIFIDHCERKWSCKKSLFVVCKILGLFVNTLTIDDKYSLLNRDNLKELIQMQLPKKQKPFCRFFASFLNFTSIFEHFEKKMTLIAYVV